MYKVFLSAFLFVAKLMTNTYFMQVQDPKSKLQAKNGHF
jgi:hypothetical protein